MHIGHFSRLDENSVFAMQSSGTSQACKIGRKRVGPFARVHDVEDQQNGRISRRIMHGLGKNTEKLSRNASRQKFGAAKEPGQSWPPWQYDSCRLGEKPHLALNSTLVGQIKERERERERVVGGLYFLLELWP